MKITHAAGLENPVNRSSGVTRVGDMVDDIRNAAASKQDDGMAAQSESVLVAYVRRTALRWARARAAFGS